MVIEGFRGSSGGGSIGGGGGGGHESQFSSLGGRLTPTGFQHQGQPSSHFDRYNWEQNRDRDAIIITMLFMLVEEAVMTGIITATIGMVIFHHTHITILSYIKTDSPLK